ncbi:MAG TPA: metallophosphoesterase [Chthoniobacterales bacterium]|nr:metallophosphoesterase [Chthoniobacterales bacterium]
MTNSQKLRLTSTHALKLIVIILALACCAISPAQNASHPPRDWATYPAVVEVNKPPGDIFAVSDLHGHPRGLYRILTSSGLLEYRPPTGWVWKGGNAVLVVVGDLIDNKNPPNTGSITVISMLRHLQELAAREGGQVIVTMGNHEAEFLADWNGNKTAAFRNELTNWAIKSDYNLYKPERVANCEGDLGRWFCRLPVAARVGEWFFAHAGYTKNRNIPTIKSDIEADFALNGFKAKQLVGKQSILEARLDDRGPKEKASDDKGLPWVFNGNKNNNPEDTLKQFTSTLGVRHIVQGHTPGTVPELNRNESGEMFQAYGGLLFLIDGDMNSIADSDNDDKYGAALRITVQGETSMMAGDSTRCITTTTQAIAIQKNGTQKTLWKETVKKTPTGEPCR